MKDFLEFIQSSEEEIYNYLNYIEAYQIDGIFFWFPVLILILVLILIFSM